MSKVRRPWFFKKNCWKRVIMALELKNRLQEQICRNWIKIQTYNATRIWNTMLKKNIIFSITTYPFTRHPALYALSVNKMPSFCTMAKECDIFSFELHSNMLNRHSHGDVRNQRFVISPRSGVLHACLSLKRQNLTTLVSKKYDFCSVFASRT